MTAIPVGLQLYSLRDACAADFFAAIRATAKAGYAGVEFAGFFDKPAKDVRRAVEDAGLGIFGAHVAFDLLLPDKFDATVAYHKDLGNTHLVVPALPDQRRTDLDEARRTVDLLNAIADKLRPLGMTTGYHTHWFDVKPLAGGDGKTVLYDLVLQNTPDDFIMQLDIGNVVQGGACPVDYLNRYPGRATQIHLKEYLTAGAKWNVPFAAGDVPWEKVFALANTTARTREYIVEVEQYWDDPAECARQNRAILKHLGV